MLKSSSEISIHLLVCSNIHFTNPEILTVILSQIIPVDTFASYTRAQFRPIRFTSDTSLRIAYNGEKSNRVYKPLTGKYRSMYVELD